MVKSEIQNVKLRFGIIGNCEGLNRAIDVAIQVCSYAIRVYRPPSRAEARHNPVFCQ